MADSVFEMLYIDCPPNLTEEYQEAKGGKGWEMLARSSDWSALRVSPRYLIGIFISALHIDTFIGCQRKKGLSRQLVNRGAIRVQLL